jgi:hypothetical protein
MTTTRKAVDALARRIGLESKRVRAVAIALTAARVIPSGAPRTPPELDPEHVVSLLIGSCLDVPLRAVAECVVAYRGLTPGGASLVGAPASLRTAGNFLDIWADIAIHGDAADLLRRDRLEIVSNWPEIALHETGNVKRWQPVGSLAGHWQSSGHRKSTTINGAAFIDAIQELFGARS